MNVPYIEIASKRVVASPSLSQQRRFIIYRMCISFLLEDYLEWVQGLPDDIFAFLSILDTFWMDTLAYNCKYSGKMLFLTSYRMGKDPVG